MGATISVEQRHTLRECFEQKINPYRAAKRAGITIATAYLYFARWGWSKPRPMPKRKPKMRGLPIYDGPDWIGKRC